MYQFETKIKIITNTNSIQTFFHPLTLDHTYHNTLKSIESFNFPISSLLITPLPPSSSRINPCWSLIATSGVRDTRDVRPPVFFKASRFISAGISERWPGAAAHEKQPFRTNVKRIHLSTGKAPYRPRRSATFWFNKTHHCRDDEV